MAAVTLGAASIASAELGTIAASADVDRVALRVSPPFESIADPTERATVELTDLVNQERNRRGLPNLLPHAQVAAAAMAHSGDMAARAMAVHFGVDGADTGDRLAREGFTSMVWGELIGAGYQTPQQLFDVWIVNEVHRAHLLSDNVYVGVGVAATAEGVPYWTLVVAT